jgi:SH3-like domain-containing protein
MAAESKPIPDAFHSTNLPLPRYASLQANEVYVRSGPGLKYPIKWVYKKPGLPVQIVLEYEVWRKIKDHEGQEGWVHLSLLSGKRTGVIRSAPETEEDKKARAAFIKEAGKPPPVEPIPVYQKPRQNARWAAKVMPGAVVGLDECVTGWCLISAEGYRGWTERKFIWGLKADESFK